ncbi:hypothetical protein [Actinomadura decatromicini]|uniref:Uncharacterized protein n=1 Tax=Actinomadura decatromicini TaxID=2604572 RepID=A0A5D3F6P8_9ACTN|nr:hypothetical protein [Actinomadura decatromicini]TYK43476.1 hypothetical protein FXF68_38360 [Actinomadura decatromicini]
MTTHDSHAAPGRPLIRGDRSALETVALLFGLALMPVITAPLASLIGPANDSEPAAAERTATVPDHGRAIGHTTALTTTTRRWTPVAHTTVTLKKPGTYEVTQQVRGQFVTARNRPTHAWIISRVFNLTAGVPVKESNLLVVSSANHPPAINRDYGTTASGRAFIDIDGPTTIRLEAMQAWDAGTVSKSQIITDPNGLTQLLYKELT